jgi:hypothetical protein
MSRLLQQRYGAVKPNEVTTELAPPGVVEATELLMKSVNARLEAESAWVAAKDALDVEVETIAERIAVATVTGAKMPVDQTDKLESALKKSAVQRDAAGKVSKQYEELLAAEIVKHRKQWVTALNEEIDRVRALVEQACTTIEEGLASVDRLKCTRQVATQTDLNVLSRLRGGSWSSNARSGLREIRKWLNPPERIPSAMDGRGRNIIGYGAMQLGQGDLGREEA